MIFREKGGAFLLVSLVAFLVTSWEACRSATYAVTTTADSGPGSLRQALLDANANPGLDVIEFHLPGRPPYTITPYSPLPGIYDPILIDGTTQSGYAGQPVVELNGASATSDANGLRVLSSDCLIRGLAINRFARDGIRLEGDGYNVIQGNYLGTDVTGTQALGNGWGGISALSASNLIGGLTVGQGNLISGGVQAGVLLLDAGAVGNTVCGNLIGTDRSGLVRLPNATNGIVISAASGNLIGGTDPGAANIISGNGGSGLYLLNAMNNTLQGNLIGLGAGGVTSVSNTADGVTLYGATLNLIGGTSAAAGNVISGNGGRGILIFGDAPDFNTVEGNLIGTDATGRRRLGNFYEGIEIQSGTGNQVGGAVVGAGNLIAGGRMSGVSLSQPAATGNTVQGNLIGTDRTGTNALGNGMNGIYLAAPGNLVGGTDALARNLISGNNLNGIYLVTAYAASNRITGNYVGTDAAGGKALGNLEDGIMVSGAPDTVIGGASVGEGNLTSGNVYSGIELNGTGATRTVLQGNRIGSDASGTRAVPNQSGGIYVYGSPTNQIGGTTPGAGNLVSGNQMDAISISDPTALGNTLSGNLIGLAADGVSPLGNEWHGVEILNSASGTVVGGLAAGAGNVIAYARTAGYDGIRVRDGCTNNAFLGNALFRNGANSVNGLGIDLGADGVAPNDHCDADTGANNLQNYPVLRAFAQAGGVLVTGSLDSVAGQAYHIEFFASANAGPSGYGEAERFLGSTSVTTGAGCLGTFRTLIYQDVPVGQYVTATATDPAGNTSELSAAAPVEATPFLDAQFDPSSQNLRLAWKPTGPAYQLEETPSLSPPISWSPVSATPQQINGTNVVTLPVQAGTLFYRLMVAL